MQCQVCKASVSPHFHPDCRLSLFMTCMTFLFWDATYLGYNIPKPSEHSSQGLGECPASDAIWANLAFPGQEVQGSIGLRIIYWCLRDRNGGFRE